MKNNYLLLTLIVALIFSACKRDDDAPEELQPDNHIQINGSEFGIEDIFKSGDLIAGDDFYYIGFTDGELTEDGFVVNSNYLAEFIISAQELATGEYRLADNDFGFQLTTLHHNDDDDDEDDENGNGNGNGQQTQTRFGTEGVLHITNNNDGTFILDFDVTLDDGENVTGYYNGPIEERTFNGNDDDEDEDDEPAA